MLRRLVRDQKILLSYQRRATIRDDLDKRPARRIGNVVMRTRGVGDTVTTAASRPPLETNELPDQPGEVEQAHPAPV